jgi:hypothetical protein
MINQDLAHEFAKKSDKIFLMIKTAADTIWQRVPLHLFTTLTRLPNFGIYSDTADSIAGYEVIDILANISRTQLVDSPQFEAYRAIRAERAKYNYVNSAKLGTKDCWVLDKFKHLKILQHAYASAPTMDWYVMIDDDSIILADNLSRFLSTLDPSVPLYLGSAVAGLEYLFAHGGSGIVLSHALVAQAFGNPESDKWVDEYTKKAETQRSGDYVLAMMLKEKVGVDLNYEMSGGHFQGESVFQIPSSSSNWCQEMITLRARTERDFELLWEYERLRGVDTPILYRDIYDDFVKPYLPSEPVAGWDNGAHDVEFSWTKNGVPAIADIDPASPYSSLEACRQQCEQRSDCLMFRYDPYKLYCGISSSSVALGSPARSNDGGRHLFSDSGVSGIHTESSLAEQQLISGWLSQRIRSMRRQQKCDPLYGNHDAEGTALGLRDQVEGWWHRAKERYSDAFPDPLKGTYGVT